MKHKRLLFTCIVLFIAAFMYRIIGEWHNTPFWVDEFSTARQAELLLKFGLHFFTQKQEFVEINKLTSILMAATMLKIVGHHEWAVRLPFVIAGSFVPVAVYLLARLITNTSVALTASIFSICSYYFITWSRQARSYVLQQLLVLLLFYQYFRIIESKKIKPHDVLFLLAIVLIGIFTHPFFYIAVFSVIVHFLLLKREYLKKLYKNAWFYVVLTFLVIFIFVSQAPYNLQIGLSTGSLKLHSNLWYYHSFLWREYGLYTFLGITGLLFGFITQRRRFSLIVLYILSHLAFICFIFGPYVTRYLLPIFSFLFIGTAMTLAFFITALIKENKIKVSKSIIMFLPVLISVLIVINGDKFVLKPKQYYSVNHDFREIALIDYRQIYNIIDSKGKLSEGRTAVIDTWPDRANWYLGNDLRSLYFFRWANGDSPLKKTFYTINSEGEKIIPPRSNLGFIGELKDLKKAQSKYPRGFIFIDDTSLPKDVLDYVKSNFKKELYLDHYTLDDNPYSIWPATLYSWGIE